MKWVVILPIFAIFMADIVSTIVQSNLPQIETADYSVIATMQHTYIFGQIQLVIASVGFFAICFVFKHCLYTWITTISFIMYEVTGLIYSILVFDYNLYLMLLYCICAASVLSLVTTFIIKLLNKNRYDDTKHD